MQTRGVEGGDPPTDSEARAGRVQIRVRLSFVSSRRLGASMPAPPRARERAGGLLADLAVQNLPSRVGEAVEVAPPVAGSRSMADRSGAAGPASLRQPATSPELLSAITSTARSRRGRGLPRGRHLNATSSPAGFRVAHEPNPFTTCHPNGYLIPRCGERL